MAGDKRGAVTVSAWTRFDQLLPEVPYPERYRDLWVWNCVVGKAFHVRVWASGQWENCEQLCRTSYSEIRQFADWWAPMERPGEPRA